MNRISELIVKKRIPILIGTLVLLGIMIICALKVKINYNMMDYLPENANSTKAIKIMSENFDESMANCNVMVENVSITKAMEIKEKISKLEAISDVQWLDDVIDITEPLSVQDKETVEMYYKDSNALFSVTVEEGKERIGVNGIQNLLGDDAYLTGNAVSQSTSQNLAVSQAIKSIMLIGPLIILVLILSTTNWLEPMLYLNTIGIAVGINWGLQIFKGEMSYVTMAVSPILQMAVSLDYAVFLCGSFEENRKKHDNIYIAMKEAIKESFGAIAASAATTLFGFVALMFMDFKVGADMGVSLVRGVILSFLAVMLLMPALLLLFHKISDKLKHKRILPDFRHSGNILLKLRVPMLIIIATLLIPAYLGQTKNTFIYGSGEPDAKSKIAIAEKKLNEIFEDHTIVALLVPTGDSTAETLLSKELEEKDYVTSVISYANVISNKIPSAYLGKDITKSFYSDDYCRIIIYTNTREEGESAFSSVKDIRKCASKYYPEDEIYMCGQSANMYDMKTTVEADSIRVDLITIIAVFLVLLIEFKSITLPFILILVIKIATWINMSIPYFTGEPLAYIGYLVVGTVMMGATIDYAILLTEHYLKYRKDYSKLNAMKMTLGAVVKSVMVSAMILAVAGFSLGLSSSEQIVKALGLLLGKGAVIAFLLSITLLPALLLLFDKIIEKTTYKATFFKEEKRPVTSNIFTGNTLKHL